MLNVGRSAISFGNGTQLWIFVLLVPTDFHPLGLAPQLLFEFPHRRLALSHSCKQLASATAQKKNNWNDAVLLRITHKVEIIYPE